MAYSEEVSMSKYFILSLCTFQPLCTVHPQVSPQLSCKLYFSYTQLLSSLSIRAFLNSIRLKDRLDLRLNVNILGIFHRYLHTEGLNLKCRLLALSRHSVLTLKRYIYCFSRSNAFCLHLLRSQ